MPFQKLLDHSYVKFPAQQLRGTLTKAFLKAPYSWRFYGHGSRYVLILSSRYYLTFWDKNKRRCLENYYFQNKCNLALQKKLHQSRWYLTCSYTHLFLANKPTFLNLTQYLLRYWIVFCHSFFIFLHFAFWIYGFFSFWASKCSYYVLFSIKYFYLLTVKITPDVNNSL